MDELKEGDQIGSPEYVHAYTPPTIVDVKDGKYNKGNNSKVHTPFIIYGSNDAEGDTTGKTEKAYLINNNEGVRITGPVIHHPLSLVLGLNFVLLRVTYITSTSFTNSWIRTSLLYRQWIKVPCDPTNFDTIYEVPLTQIKPLKQNAIAWRGGIIGQDVSLYYSDITFSYTRPIKFSFTEEEGFTWVDGGGFTVNEPGATNDQRGAVLGPGPPGHGGFGSGERTPLGRWSNDTVGAYCTWINFTNYPMPFDFGQTDAESVAVRLEDVFTEPLEEGKYVDYLGEDESKDGFDIKFVNAHLTGANWIYYNPREGIVAADGTMLVWSEKWEGYGDNKTVG